MEARIVRDNRQWIKDLAAAGDVAEQAHEDLRRYLFRGLYKALASKSLSSEWIEDFAQEAVLKVLTGLDKFRGESRFTTWAMAIAMRVAFTELRLAKWKDVSLDGLRAEERLTAPEPRQEENLQKREVLGILRRVLREELSEKQRQVLLGELAGVPKAVLEDRLGTNRNALYKLSHDARRRLKAGILGTGISEAEIRTSFGL